MADLFGLTGRIHGSSRLTAGPRTAALEPLEPRLLLDATFPTDYEQYMLELINRARAGPLAEVARYDPSFWDGTPGLNEGLAPGTITADPKQPLVFNPDLAQAARGHSQWMLDHDVFGHDGASGSDPGGRMEDAGYAFAAPWGWGENIAWRGFTGSFDVTEFVYLIEGSLFGDAGIPGRGHRISLMKPEFREVGIGVVLGEFTDDGTAYDSVMVTEDFAYSGGDVYLTGVIFDDTRVEDDDLYTPGEGLGGVTVVAVRQSDGAPFETATWDAGGYNLVLPPGTYDLTVSGRGVLPAAALGIVVADQNVKRDFALITYPDLTVSPAGYTPGTYAPGHTLAATIPYENDADTAAGAFTYELRLSPDTVWGDANDVVLHVGTDDGLPGEGAHTASVSATVPGAIPQGSYYLAARVDAADAVTESDETNNTWWSSSADVTIGQNQPPTVGSLTAAPDPVTQPIALTLTAAGVSDPDLGDGVDYVAFYRDTNANAQLDAADQLLGTDTAAAGGWSWTGSSGDLPTGTSRFFARAHDGTDPGNVVTATATIHPGSGIDLTGTIDEAKLPVWVRAGDKKNTIKKLTVLVSNQGTNTPEGIVAVDLYASSDQTLHTASDYKLGTVWIKAKKLKPGKIAKVKLKLPKTGVPALPPGHYYLLAAVDPTNALDDVNPLDNVAVSTRTIEWRA